MEIDLTYSEVRFTPSVTKAKWLLPLLPVLDDGLVTVSDRPPAPEFTKFASVVLLILLELPALFAF